MTISFSVFAFELEKVWSSPRPDMVGVSLDF